MASNLYLDPRNGQFNYRRLFSGRRIYVPLDTKNEDRAQRLAAQIDDRLLAAKKGLIVLPEGADLIHWIKTGSHLVHEELGHKNDPSFGSVIESYSKSRPAETTAETTRKTEDIHLNHLKRVIGQNLPIKSMSAATLRKYVESRIHEVVRGKFVTGPTVRKELHTFRRVWRFAVAEKIVTGDPPTATVLVPKGKAKEPFRTFNEIQKLVQGMDDESAAELWECCVLFTNEITEFLSYAKKKKPNHWVHAAVTTCAYTGIRRSEMIRSRVEDWDLKNGKLIVRELKRVHNRHGSLRTIDIHPNLVTCITEYMKIHPGGSVMFGDQRGVKISRSSATDQWRRLVASSKWEHINGWHTLRHSFASNLAASGVDAALIDRWMGHQTQEQRDRYRHFFPKERNDAISRLAY